MSATVAARAEETLLLRQDSLTEVGGRIELRDLGRLDVELLVPCEEVRDRCVERLDLDRVVALTFVEELRERAAAGAEAEMRMASRGTILVGGRLDDARARPLIDGLAGLARRLEPGSFRKPFAGVSNRDPELAASTLTGLGDLFLLCFRYEAGDTLLRYDRRTDGERTTGFGTAGYDRPELTGPACDRLESSLRHAPAEVLRTMTRPLSVIEARVEADGASRLPGHAVDDNRAALPEGIELASRPVTDGAIGGRGASRDETLHRGYVIQDGTRHEAGTRPVELGPEVLDRAFPLRFRWSMTERTFGPRPRATLVERGELIAAVVPVEPGTDPVPLDPAGWLAAIAERIDDAERIERAIVRQAVLDNHSELAVRGYLLVTCDDDETARYHLPPSMVDNRVTNAAAVCDTLRKGLD